MFHYKGSDNHSGRLVASTIVTVPQTLVVFLFNFVLGKVIGKLDPAVGLAQSREGVLEFKQVVTEVLRVVFHTLSDVLTPKGNHFLRIEQIFDTLIC